MQCEREDAMFMGVSLMVRLVSPRKSCKGRQIVSLLPCMGAQSALSRKGLRSLHFT